MEKKRKNKLFYTLTMLVILIIFLVIFLSGKYLKDIIFVDNLPKQPINNIKSIEEEKLDDAEFIYTFDRTYGNYIYLENQFPITDEVGRSLEGAYKTFDFKLKFNDSAVGVKYEIILEKLPESDLENNWVKVYLESEGKGVDNTFRTNGRIKTFNEYKNYNKKNNEVVLYSGTVTAKEAERGYKNFRLRMWISEDVKVVNQNYESKTIVARVNVHASGNV